MKTLVTGLIFLGFTSLCYSQSNGDTKVKEEALATVTVTPLNTSYLNKVQDDNTPDRVKILEDKAARYDITELSIFNGKFESYEVIFEQTESRIIATYDGDGKIINSLERFENVSLPASVRNTVYKQYPGWAIHKDVYLVSYFENKEAKRHYKIQVRKEGARKNIKLDASGGMIK
ncbi:MAG: hypothetical protein KC469_12570 [Flavobacteriaceae bacterium]|nr:hypothetical protein [Flavobacteriaceae bacterium]